MSISQLHDELESLRSAVDQLLSARPPRDRANAMLHQLGLEGPLAAELAKGASRVVRRGPEAFRKWIEGKLEGRIHVESSLLHRPDPVLISCVGPTGAGKTTTLAKLAAQARLDLGRRVSVISLDTYRVGAVEQWQRYAELIGLPFGVAKNPEEFSAMLNRQRADIVLVDTAGRHGSESDRTWELPSYLGQETRYEKHVLTVLPAWLSARDAEATMAQYRKVTPNGIVCTKLDESRGAGGLVTAAVTSELPISYLCNGPRVPEDIHEATVDSLLESFFRSAI